MKHIMLLLGIFSIVLVTATDIDAQRRTRDRDRDRTRDRDRVEDKDVIGNIYHAIHIGNFSLGNFSNSFNISAKYAAGYNFHERFSGGLSGKFFYDVFFQPGPNDNFFSYGTGAFMRAKITRGIYLQAEYDVTSYEESTTRRDMYTYPLIGGGYESGQGAWTGGLNVMLILNGDVVDSPALNGRPIEWWFTTSYNF